ncbi:MAG: peptidoglycan-N-acetylglucosamine deacetylase [Bacillales bacterium]|nr:peptidoglycan-N-acetylglucosamine deacetylase [Bacillales bacterium]
MNNYVDKCIILMYKGGTNLSHILISSKKRFFFIFATLIFFSVTFLSAHNIFNTVSAENKFSGDLHLIDVLEVDMVKKKSPTKWGNEGRKIVYLTFDDGPNKYSHGFLDILNNYNVKATFFYIGNNINKQPDVLLRSAKEGHYPGLHSMTHNYRNLYLTNSVNLANEMQLTQDTVYKYLKIRPDLTRVPYGSYPQVTPEQREELLKRGLKMWDWTIDSNDWKYPNNPNLIVKHIGDNLKDDSEIILFHERKQTLLALPKIIELIESRGYTFEIYNPDEHLVVNFWQDKKL